MTSTDRPQLRSLALLGLCFVGSVAAYGFTANDFFVSDDFGLLLQAQRADSFVEAAGLAEGDRPRWIRPVVDLTWWTCFRAFGVSPMGHHALNMVLHAANAWLLGLLIFRLTAHHYSAYVGAVLFAIFPIHSEAVVWVSGRYDVFCATWYLSSLYFWTLFCAAKGRWFHLLGAAIAFAMALLCKEMALSMPAVAAAIAFVFYRPVRKQIYVGGATLILVLAAYLVFRYQWLGGLGGYQHDGQTAHDSFDPIRTVRFIFRALYYSLQPAHRRLNPHAFSLLRLIPTLIVLAATLIAIRQGGIRRVLPFLLFFLLSLIPLASWASLSRDNQSARFLYLPSVFVCAILGWLLAFPANTNAHRRCRAAAIAVIGAAYLVAAIQIATTWHRAAAIAQNSITQLRRTLEAHPEIDRIVATQPPDHYHGAYIFRNGLQEAVVLFVDPSIQTETLAREAWELRRRGSVEPGTLFLAWDANRDPIIEIR